MQNFTWNEAKSPTDDDLCPLCCEPLSIEVAAVPPCKCSFVICQQCVTKLVQGRYTKCPHCRNPYRIEEIDQRNSAAFIERELRKNPSTPRDQEKINRLARLRVKQLKKLQELLQQVYEIQDSEERRQNRDEEIAAEDTLPTSTPTFGTSRLKRAKTFCGGDSRLSTSQTVWDIAELPIHHSTPILTRDRPRSTKAGDAAPPTFSAINSLNSETTNSPFSPMSERTASSIAPDDEEIHLDLPPSLQKRGASVRLSIKEIEDIEKEIKIVQNENFDDYDYDLQLPAFDNLDSNIDPEEQAMFKRLASSRSRDLSGTSNDIILPLITSFDDLQFESSDEGVVFKPFTPTKADLENMSSHSSNYKKAEMWLTQQQNLATPFYSYDW